MEKQVVDENTIGRIVRGMLNEMEMTNGTDEYRIPGKLDKDLANDIFLCSINERMLYDRMLYPAQELLEKKLEKGVELDLHTLSESGMMRKITSACINWYVGRNCSKGCKVNTETREFISELLSEHLIQYAEDNFRRTNREEGEIDAIAEDANICEGVGARQVKSRDEFIDIMTGMKGRKFITYGYVTGVELPNMPKKMVPNPEYGVKPRVRREKSVGDWEALGGELGREGAIGGIIKFTTYNCKYSNAEEIGKAYNDYKSKRDEIRSKYGIDAVKDAAYGTDKFGYGTGVKQYGGDNEENAGHLYSDQNLYGSTKKSKYFIVDADGNVDTGMELDYGEIKQYVRQSKPFDGNPEHGRILGRLGGSDSGYTQLVKLGADDATITSYLNDLDALKMRYQRFIFDKIVFMVGKVNGEHFYYFNPEINTVVKNLNVNVNLRSLMDLAVEKYRDSIADLDALNSDSSVREIAESTELNEVKNFMDRLLLI